MAAKFTKKPPPIPAAVVTTDGQSLFTGDQILAGQDVWRSIGGQELGSIWGHGAYTAPDWTADWLHREAIWILAAWATRDYGQTYESLNAEQQASLRARLEIELRTNTYDPATGAVEVSLDRAEAIGAVQSHFVGLFGSDPELDELRESYAMPADTVSPNRAGWTSQLSFSGPPGPAQPNGRAATLPTPTTGHRKT